MKNKLIFLLCFICGAVFILSSYYKLYPIEPFEYKIVGTTFFGWLPAIFVARIVIAAEFGIGVLLLFSYRLRFTLKLAMGTLVLFCLHLIVVLILQGNSSDCGCMGSLMEFTPLQGLLKNAVLIGICVVAYKNAFEFRLAFKHIEYYVFLLALCGVFAANPIDLSYSEKYLNKPFEVFSLNLDTLYTIPVHDKVEAPVKDIRTSKTILAFVSASCPHCKIAAQKIAVIHRKNPTIPFYFFVNGDQDKIDEFLRKTETADIAHSKLNGQLFVEMAGLHLPVIYYYNAGKIDKQVDYFTLEQYHIEEWLKH